MWRILNVKQAQLITKQKEVRNYKWYLSTQHLHVTNQQDPFPGISEAYKEPLKDKDIETLKVELGPFDMDQFLEIFYEFIVTHVKSRPDIEADDP